MEEDGLHHLLAELRTGGPDRGRPHRQGPGRQGPPHVTGLCLREVAAHGLLSKRRRPHHQPEAAARGRQLRRHRLGHRHSGDRRKAGRRQSQARRRQHPLLRWRQPGQPPRRHLCRQHHQGPGRRLPLQRPGAGEDRRSLGPGQDDGRRRARRFRARRGLGLPGQEPVPVARLRAHTGDPARDPEGPESLDDRHRPAPQRDRRDGGLPPRRAPGHRCVVPGRIGSDPGPGRLGRQGVAGRAHDRLRPCGRSPAAHLGARLRQDLRHRHHLAAPGGRTHRAGQERVDDRGPGRADEPALHAQQLPEPSGVVADRALRPARDQQRVRAAAQPVVIDARNRGEARCGLQVQVASRGPDRTARSRAPRSSWG